MLKIKDYLVLKDIQTYLETVRDDQIRDNRYPNDIDWLNKMLLGLQSILYKLEEGE